MTVLSLPAPVGSYVIYSKAVISAGASTSVSCQLQLQSALTILDQSLTQIGYDAQSAILANTSATTLVSPDTVLLVCQGGEFGGASYGQLIAMQVTALN